LERNTSKLASPTVPERKRWGRERRLKTPERQKRGGNKRVTKHRKMGGKR